MKFFEHRLSFSAIALVLAFGIVAEAEAETVSIKNTVYSYSSSDQKGQDGQDGEDGERGQDGADGQSGSDAQSVITGSGKATVKINTTVNGETKTSLLKEHDGDEVIMSAANASAGTENELSPTERARIFSLLDKIRLILINYVFGIL